MKKVFYLLMGVSMLSMMSCNSCNKDPEPVFTGYDFEAVIASDHKNMVEQYGDSVAFYEAQAWYKHEMYVVDSNYIVMIRNVFQYKDTSISVFHVMDSTKLDELIEYAGRIKSWSVYTIDTNKFDYTLTLIVNDFWMEDQAMNLNNVNVTLDSALTIVRGLEHEATNSVFVVMRQPLCPPFPTNPYYIFGNKGQYAEIDSKTGEVVNEY